MSSNRKRVAVASLESGVEARQSWPDLAGADRSGEGLRPGPASARGAVEGSESGVEARRALEADLVLDCRDTLHNHCLVCKACADPD